MEDHDFNCDVVSTLLNLMNHDELNVVLLGQSGTGKTTLLNNIISKYYADISATKEAIAANIMHISILSEYSVTFFRNNLKVFCQVNTCIPKRKKIVRIDNLDLISEQNQYIIRGLFDKYSHNVHFICCASTCSRVIDQLQSRFTLLNLRLPTSKVMSQILARVVMHEDIHVTKPVADYIITSSKQNVARMLGFLEKLRLCKTNIHQANIHNICDGISYHIFEEYTRLCLASNIAEAIKVILGIYNDGYSSIDIFNEYYQYIQISEKIAADTLHQIIFIISQYTHKFYETYEHELTFIFFTNDIVRVISTK